MDECVFYWGSIIFIVCVDNGMLSRKSKHQLSNIAKELQDTKTSWVLGIHTSCPHWLNHRGYWSLLCQSSNKVHPSCFSKDSPCFQRISYLQQSLQLQMRCRQISYIAQTTSYLSQEHGEAIVYLVRYCLKTHHSGIKFATDQTKGFEFNVDADFCGNWDKQFASSNPSTK